MVITVRSNRADGPRGHRVQGQRLTVQGDGEALALLDQSQESRIHTIGRARRTIRGPVDPHFRFPIVRSREISAPVSVFPRMDEAPGLGALLRKSPLPACQRRYGLATTGSLDS